MNRNHQRVCTSPEWAAQLVSDVLSPLSAGVPLGPELLEIGPGPGAATEWLRSRVRSLIAVEIDPVAAQALRARFPDTNVEVVTADATELPWPDGSFDTVASFTMLHHVPTQQRPERRAGRGATGAAPGWRPARVGQPSQRLAARVPRRGHL